MRRLRVLIYSHSHKSHQKQTMKTILLLLLVLVCCGTLARGEVVDTDGRFLLNNGKFRLIPVSPGGDEATEIMGAIVVEKSPEEDEEWWVGVIESNTSTSSEGWAVRISSPVQIAILSDNCIIP